MTQSDNYTLDSLFTLAGRNIAVTGAGGQIGGEIVRAAVALGARVAASDADPAALEERWGELGYERVARIACDIRDKTMVATMFDAAEDAIGPVDALVNNAGVSVFDPFLARSEADFDFVMDVNLKGTFWCIREFLQRRQSAGGGAIVNIASHYGVVSPDPRIYVDGDRRNSEIYGASKAGVIQMTRYFAAHAAPMNIRVNAVAPGGVRNPWSPQSEPFQEKYSLRCPMGRLAELHEIPGAVIFLLSPAASYINGHTLVVDGGFTAW